MRCWRRPDGLLAVEVIAPSAPTYLSLDGDLVVGESAVPDLESWHELPPNSLTLQQLAAVVAHPRLPRLVEKVYEAFAEFERPARIVGCSCCVAPDADCVLVAKPLRELTLDDLDTYLWKAVTTWGTPADFRYFVPRVLELVVLDEPHLLDLNVVLGKLVLAGWKEWPAACRSSVDHLLHGYWYSYLTRYPGVAPAREVLDAISQLIDVQSLLSVWTPLPGRAAFHLCDLLESGQTSAPVRRWLRDPDLVASVESAFFRADDPQLAQALSTAELYLRT